MKVSTRGARRSAWIWCLGAVSFLAVAQPASAEVFLGAINVPLDGSRAYSAPLVAGGVYRAVASGTYTQTGGSSPEPVVRDALYCFSFYAPPVGCSPPDPVRRQYLTVVRYEGDPSLVHDLDNLDPASALPYNPLHTYQQTFTAPSSSRLEIFCNCNPIYSYQGGIRLDLYLVSLPPAATPGGGGPPAGAPPVKKVTRRILDPATTWGQAGPATALAPGDEVVAPSPRIAPGQHEASVTVTGDRAGKIVVAAQTSAKDCVRLFITDRYKWVPGFKDGVFGINQELAEDDDEFFLSLLGLLACLEEARSANSAKPAAAARVAAARSRCGRSTARVKVRLDRAARKARWEVRRSRRGPSKRLRVSCRLARDGAVTMRIRTTSRRPTLRKLVGPRLVVGVYRTRESSGTAPIRATFKRR